MFWKNLAVISLCLFGGSGAAETPRLSVPASCISQGWLTYDDALCVGQGSALVVYRADGAPFRSEETTCHIEEYENHTRVIYDFPAVLIEDEYESIPLLGDAAWRRCVRVKNTSSNQLDITGVEFWFAPKWNETSKPWKPATFRMIQTSPHRLFCLAGWSEADDHYFVERERSEIGLALNTCWRLKPGEEAAVGYAEVWLAQSEGSDPFRHEARRWYATHGFEKPLRYPEWIYTGILYEASAGGHIDSRFSDVGGFRAFSHQLEYLRDLGVNVLWLNAVHRHKTPPDPVRGGWNLYDPLDFYQIDPILGGETDLKYFAEKAKACGMHLIGEIVPHGGHAVQAEQLERWWLRSRDLTPTRPWGGYGMDYASPEWQAVMRDAINLVARITGIEGARIDVADGNGPNWGSPRTNHASYSTIGGGIEIQQAVRDGIRATGVALPVLLPESGKNRPEYFAIPEAAILGYGMEFTDFLRRHLQFDLSDATRLRRVLVDFLEEERGSLPPGALIVRTLGNHDTVCAHGRSTFQFGTGLARALYGVCLSVPGIPMLYQEEEVGSWYSLRATNWARRGIPELAVADADYTTFSFAPEVFTALRFLDDTCVAVCLVNLSPKTITREVHMRSVRGLESGTRLYDAVTGKTTRIERGKLKWTIPPYSTTLFRVNKPPEPKDTPAAFAAQETQKSQKPPHSTHPQQIETGSVVFGTLVAKFLPENTSRQLERFPDGRFCFRSERGEITIMPAKEKVMIQVSISDEVWGLRLFGVDRWIVMGQTARLYDRFIQRRFPFPEESAYHWDKSLPWINNLLYQQVAPTGRLWQSVVEPLDKAQPTLGFADRVGNGITITLLESSAENIVLTDCGDEPDGNNSPPHLELRFYGLDRDLQPHVAALGPMTPWRLASSPEAGRTTVRLEIAFSKQDIEKLIPVKKRYKSPERPGFDCTAPFSVHNNILFAHEPAKLTWSRLKTPQGTYYIRLTLRTSERSPDARELCDAYRVLIDGTDVPLTWTSFEPNARLGNAYFGMAQTPPLTFTGKELHLTIQTLKPWCAIEPTFSLEKPE
ncbi:MAG TPA: alpha-amylase family glycosyl hydrolase [Candidatus Hydrogenedentes bacterium]|nr:alpha-amylase family glycosyl hydrolase [Candidatus Hydrogenedentota bacterium]HOL77486.1 alpha-amylase family glycosyl hydrolase [Candidatus Hydrogenedentota bacterium]HPO86267.1 alpha-amylase family glycosyl hydrolase [Candidatus Hydrogenedentota bacterium]